MSSDQFAINDEIEGFFYLSDEESEGELAKEEVNN